MMTSLRDGAASRGPQNAGLLQQSRKSPVEREWVVADAV